MISADQIPNHRANRNTRRLDLALIAISAPLWVPVAATLAIAVLLASGRPVFFRQQRVGLNGQPFSMIKFRSMATGENPLVPDATRITRIGTVLRRSSLDELPQLLNVIRGQMSLVGPRPMLPAQVDALSDTERARHSVRPGLTGLAQVSGRNSLLWEERFNHDLVWAHAPRTRTYLHILFRTIRVVVLGQGVHGHDSTDRFVDLSTGRSEPSVVRLIDFDLTGSEDHGVLQDNERAASS